MLETGKAQEHLISSRNRAGFKISGVNDVLSVDESRVQFKTVCGDMIVEGEDLKVSSLDLDTGNVEVQGTLCGLFYIKENASPKRGLFGRNK